MTGKVRMKDLEWVEGSRTDHVPWYAYVKAFKSKRRLSTTLAREGAAQGG